MNLKKNKKYKVIFFGTPLFAVPALEALIKDERFDVVAVVTEPDRKAGRGKKVASSPVKKFVEDYNKERDSSAALRGVYPDYSIGARNDKQMQILQPARVTSYELRVMKLQPDVAVVAAYGQIIPQEILEIPKHGFINIHPSLLPKYRGPSPIQAAILNGDKETGVSIMKIDEKMDHGNIISNFKFKISNLNFSELSKELSKIGAELLIKTLPDYLEEKIKPKPQNHTKATFTKLIKKEDGLIDWKEPVEKIERKIRAYFPWPGTYIFLNGKRLKILKFHLKTITSSTPEVAEVMVLDQVQLEGKKPVNWEEFKRGYRQNIDISDKVII